MICFWAAKMKRGLFIVLEGLDRSGKGTQIERICCGLRARGDRVQQLAFPKRDTETGRNIDAYLSQAPSSPTPDQLAEIHQLFADNRREVQQAITDMLEDGMHVVCDRYAFSGSAFSVANGMDYKESKRADIGLLVPDIVLYLRVKASTVSKRPGFGEERYESVSVQTRAADVFSRLAKEPSIANIWSDVDASMAPDAVEAQIWSELLPMLSKQPKSLSYSLWRE